jgi:hypothetical protein
MHSKVEERLPHNRERVDPDTRYTGRHSRCAKDRSGLGCTTGAGSFGFFRFLVMRAPHFSYHSAFVSFVPRDAKRPCRVEFSTSVLSARVFLPGNVCHRTALDFPSAVAPEPPCLSAAGVSLGDVNINLNSVDSNWR